MIMYKVISRKELTNLLSDPILAEELSLSHGCSHLIVDAQSSGKWPKDLYPGRCPIIALGSEQDIDPAAPIDMICSEEQIDFVVESIAAQPEASSIACQVLRTNALLDSSQGLIVESLAYSVLLESHSFQSWLKNREKTRDQNRNDANVIIEREDDTLHITLDRPRRHNAYSESLKDKFCDALQLPIADPSIVQVIISGKGPSFCSGGDLDEFGSVTNASSSHISRISRSAGNLLSKIRDKTHFRVHGACIGAGIELTAFSSSISAHEASFFQLPEVSMGLIPGAGGTVSINRRIGRCRTAYMAITGSRIDSQTALEGGLVDKLFT